MAHMYPQKENLEAIPQSEKSVYEFLEKLPDTFYVFHSVKWFKPNKIYKNTWKENDFVILNKKLGGLVLEVKGGDIQFRDGVFHQINSQTHEENILSSHKRNDPLSQATDGIFHFRRMLDRIKYGLSEKFMFDGAVWFSTCEIRDKIKYFPNEYREVDKAVLGYEDFENSLVVNQIFEFYNSQHKTNVTDQEFQLIVDAIAQDFDLITAPAIKKGELDKAFIKLTNEQIGLLDYISEQNSATIQGVAGTGKTIIAKEAAKRFAADGRKVLFLCFNRFLFEDLQRRYPYENVTYLNINAFVSKYAGKYVNNAEERKTTLWDIDVDKLDFDDVVIDEAQDFENEEIEYFKVFMEEKEGHFLVFYDKNQLLTTVKVPEWIEKSECKLLLTKNCRNTKEIAKTAYNVIDVELNQKISMISGEPTSISFVAGNSIPLLGKLIRLLKDEHHDYDDSDIVFLSLKPENESILRDVEKIEHIPVCRERKKNGLFFTTSKKFKGLESKVIIIVDIDVDCFKDEAQKRNFYVACSRATHKLILFVNADTKQIEEMAKNIAGKIGKPQGKIISKTQSVLLNL